jgi:hypothetical protein
MTIPPGVSQPANLLVFDDEASRLVLPLRPVKAGLEPNMQNPNNFRFQLAVSADGALTVRKTALVHWGGDPSTLSITLGDAT